MAKLSQPPSLSPRWQAQLDDHVIALSWSPDGSRIAAALTSYQEGDQGSSILATVGVDGTGYQQTWLNSSGNNGNSSSSGAETLGTGTWYPDPERDPFEPARPELTGRAPGPRD